MNSKIDPIYIPNSVNFKYVTQLMHQEPAGGITHMEHEYVKLLYNIVSNKTYLYKNSRKMAIDIIEETGLL